MKKLVVVIATAMGYGQRSFAITLVRDVDSVAAT